MTFSFSSILLRVSERSRSPQNRAPLQRLPREHPGTRRAVFLANEIYDLAPLRFAGGNLEYEWGKNCVKTGDCYFMYYLTRLSTASRPGTP